MNKDTFASIMTEAFSSYGRDMTTNSGKLIMASWYKYFGDRDEQRFRKALDLHIMNKNTQPKVSDIIGLLGNHQQEGRGKYVCPDCGVETDNLYRLGPSIQKSVCSICYDDVHIMSRLSSDVQNPADLRYLEAIAAEHKVNKAGIPIHLKAANLMNIDFSVYVQDLPRNHEQIKNHISRIKPRIGGMPYKGE